MLPAKGLLKSIMTIGWQVRLVRLQMDNFHFLHQQKDKRQTFIRTMSKTVSGLRKIAWASVFRSKWRKTELAENGNIRFVCCKWKIKMANLHLFAANGNRKLKFVRSANYIR